MEKSLIVAVADNLAIGRKNALLWNLPEDMKYFRRTTVGHPVIMGYMTFLSLGSRPLPRRTNIVISEFPWPDAPEGILIAGSLQEAYDMAEATGAERCFVIGGAYTYRQAEAVSDSMYITHVHDTVSDADAFFPEISPMRWEVESCSETCTDPACGLCYEFVIYKRK